MTCTSDVKMSAFPFNPQAIHARILEARFVNQTTWNNPEIIAETEVTLGSLGSHDGYGR